jgi:hypothetical protein
MDKYEHLLHFFGYAKDEKNPEEESYFDKHTNLSFNKFGFYDYKGKAKKENQDKFMGYLDLN